MSAMDSDTSMRLAAFAHIRQLLELRDGLTASDLAHAAESLRRASLASLPICHTTWQRNRAAAARFREASQSHVSDSPSPGEDRKSEWPGQTKEHRLSLRFERFRAAY
jgi:hypothetical protein